MWLLRVQPAASFFPKPDFYQPLRTMTLASSLALALLCLGLIGTATAHAAPSASAAAVPLQTYASYSVTEEGIVLGLLADGKATFTLNFYGETTKEQGTWSQQGSRVTVKTKGKKGKSGSTWVFDYQSELRSSDSLFKGCKKFPEGLRAISVDNQKLPRGQEQNYYVWPEKLASRNDGPCLSN